MKSDSELQFEPVKEFVGKVGDHVLHYFEKDTGCVIYLKPHGVFYAVGLVEWLKKKKKNVTLCTMNDDGENLPEQFVKNRKVLIVDGDVVTGKAYKRATEALRLRKEELGIKDIKFAAYTDRVGLSDFSVWNYGAEATWRPADLDALDFKIISLLNEDGRMSFTDIGKKLDISGVAVKSRVEWLLSKKILEIRAHLSMGHFYAMSAMIFIDADQKALQKLIEKLQIVPEVYYLVKRIASHNLGIGILARNLDDIEDFVEKEIRSVQGVSDVDIRIQELPTIPRTFSPSHFVK